MFTANGAGEMDTGTSTLVIDTAVPVNPPQSIAFTDVEPDPDEVQGDISIAKAVNESDIDVD